LTTRAFVGTNPENAANFCITRHSGAIGGKRQMKHSASHMRTSPDNLDPPTFEITEENVKVRLHRARALLRKSLYARAGMERKEAFNFHAVRCDRVVQNVFERIQKHDLKAGNSAPSMQ